MQPNLDRFAQDPCELASYHLRNRRDPWEVMASCLEQCQCQDCGNDLGGYCAAEEGDCRDCARTGKCPVSECPNFS